MRKAWLLAGAALVGFSGVVAASTARAETLEEVLASAYLTNPSLQARRAEQRSVDEGVARALSGWRPSIRYTASAARTRTENNQYALPVQEHLREQLHTPTTQAVTIAQNLYQGGRTVASTRQAEASVLAERAQLHATEQQVLLNAATAYLNVVRDEAVLKLNINNEQVLRRQLEAAQERFRVGEITRTDVSQAEARLARSMADRVQAEGTLQASRANFVNVIGAAPQNLEPAQNGPAVPASFDEVKVTALAKNPNVIARDWTAQAAKDAIDVQRSVLLPSVDLRGDYSRSHGSTFADNVGSNLSEIDSLGATLQVTVPIYEAGEAYASVRSQKHTYGQRRIEADQARRDALESASAAWENLQAARARIKSYESQIQASEMALAGVEEEAKVGSRTVLDVLDAEQELFDARVNLVRAQRDSTVAAYTLKQAIGQLTAEALGLQVGIYDPVKHYEDVRGRFIGTGIEPLPGYEEYEFKK
ncbi:MAG: TolC family outer membrane protein [Solirubrobacterales bacterium]